MSKLKVEIDYVKIAQYHKCIQYYLKRIEDELDMAVIERRIDDREHPTMDSIFKVDFSSNL